jgi:hypothetical protein
MGEPINAVLSGNSDEDVLVDSEEFGGFRNYMLCVPSCWGVRWETESRMAI